MIYKCNHCVYEGNWKYNLRVHKKNKHEYHEAAGWCAHCNYKSSDKK